MIKTVLVNTIAQIAGKAATATSTLTVTLLISRFLGPEGYGNFTKAFVFVGYFYTFVDFGLNSIYLKLVNKNEFELLKILAGLRLIFAVLFTFGSIAIANILPFDAVNSTGFSPLVKTTIFIASFTILTQSIQMTANAFFQHKLKYYLSTITSVSSAIILLIWSLAVSLTNPTIALYATGYIAAGLVAALVAIISILQLTGKVLIPGINKKYIMLFISQSWPLAIALVTNLFYFRNDIFILANTHSPSEVGIYGFAYQFFENSLVLPLFFTNALFPILIAAKKNNFIEFKNKIITASKLLILGSFIAFIALQIIANLIPTFDIRYQQSKSALTMLSFGLPFFFLTTLIWHIFIIYNKQKDLLIIYVFGALVNLCANLIFIPEFGFKAAAISTIISEGFILLLLLLDLYKISKYDRGLL